MMFVRQGQDRYFTAEVFIQKNENGNHYWQVIRNIDGYVLDNGWRVNISEAKADATRA